MSLHRESGRDPVMSTGTARPLSPSEILEPARAPSHPRGRRPRRESPRISGFVRFVSGVLTASLLLLALLGGVGAMLYRQFEQPGPLEVSRTVAIAKGDGRIEIAERLEREGVISSRWVFMLNHMMRSRFGARKFGDLKAGEYEFKKNVSMAQVLDTLTEGRSILQKITVPEGLTSQQIVERLKADDSLSGDIAEIPPEGTLLPDTYRFSKGMSRQELIERMRDEQQRVVAGLWEKRQTDLPIATPAEAVILASIVEKETGRADERERVAAVFVNRLKKRMRLQSDPTIIYGLVGGAGSLGRGITRAEIDQRTAYNTYQIDGLPPTPICNPGRSAIEATLNPAKTKDLYFVADGNGGHDFSETLKEHNSAVQNWRKIEREAKKEEAAATAAGTTRAVSRPAPPPGQTAAGAAPIMPAGGTEQAAAETPPEAAKASAVPLPVRKPKQR
jgi:UPF0755 protein